MTESAFDTITVAQELEKYEFTPKQAEGAALMLYRHLVGNVVTKNDLTAEVDRLRAEIFKNFWLLGGGIITLIVAMTAAFVTALNLMLP